MYFELEEKRNISPNQVKNIVRKECNSRLRNIVKVHIEEKNELYILCSFLFQHQDIFLVEYDES